jgi:mono/diheme cytochrome c family protein
MPVRFLAALSLLAILLSAGAAQEPTQLERGHALVERMCAECHAVGAAGESRHPNAPPFRQLGRLLDFETFVGRLREGLMVAHPDMPTFRFTRQEARAVAAYLISIQP